MSMFHFWGQLPVYFAAIYRGSISSLLYRFGAHLVGVVGRFFFGDSLPHLKLRIVGNLVWDLYGGLKT